ncbi:MAG TPA: hypothetical protein VGO64_00360, partial [Candidatus Limnocylindrales bacterium]|nr:hypothetical protein [Candidatus Limnocylindrales bacterium]
MRSPIRRSLVLVTLVALLLGVLASTAPTAFAGDSHSLTNTRVRGIDVDRATIPQLERAMDHDKVSARARTPTWSARSRSGRTRSDRSGCTRPCPVRFATKQARSAA